MNACSIAGCDSPSLARGWCSAHWQRWKRNGDPIGGRPSIATEAGEPKDFIEKAMGYQGDGCLIWPFHRVNGYAAVGKTSVSRIICEKTNGPCPVNHEAAHACGRGHLGCIAPKHLRWATHVDNCADKLAHGTHNRGERHSMAKLTDKDVAEIRALSGTTSQRALGALFGVSQAQIWRIVSGENRMAA